MYVRGLWSKAVSTLVLGSSLRLRVVLYSSILCKLVGNLYVYWGLRMAIEEELEVLYEAYYQDLEQYANYQQQYASSGGTIPPPPGPGPFPGSVAVDQHGAVIGAGIPTKHPPAKHKTAPPNVVRKPAKGAVAIAPGDEEEYDDGEGDDDYDEDAEYEEDEDDEDEEDDEEDAEDAEEEQPGVKGTRPRRTVPVKAASKVNGRSDLFSPENSLTVTGRFLLLALYSIMKPMAYLFTKDQVTSLLWRMTY